MIWSSSARSILKGWFGLTGVAVDPDPAYGDKLFRRSSAVTMGAILPAPPEADAVQASKSYMEVSMSANKTSSRVRSVRKPEEEEELMSNPPGSWVSIRRDSCAPAAGWPSDSKADTPSFWLQGLAPSLESIPIGATEGRCGSAPAGLGGEVAVGPCVSQRSSISSRAEEKLSFAMIGVGLWGVLVGSGVHNKGVSSSSREAGVRQESGGTGVRPVGDRKGVVATGGTPKAG